MADRKKRVQTVDKALRGKVRKLIQRDQRVPGVRMLFDWNLLCFYRGVLINSPNSEYLYMTFRSLRTARDYIKKERRNGK